MAAGDKAFWSDVADAVNRSIGRLIQQAAQAIAHNTAVAITFGTGSESIDFDGFHSESVNNTRVTPTKAGYYKVKGTVFLANATTYSNVSCWIRKNGSANLPPAGRLGGLAWQGSPASAPTGQVAAVACECLTDMNGTTDYFELICQQVNTASAAVNTNQSSQYSCVLEWEYMRPL